MRHHARPDRNTPNAPLAAISSAVPRSGCSAMSPTGITISTPTAPSVIQPGGSGRPLRYHATIIGMVSFSSSDGWKRTTPRSSQRCAPRPSPSSATATSSTRCRHKATASSCAAPAAARARSAASARGRARSAATARAPVPRSRSLALYSVASPTAHQREQRARTAAGRRAACAGSRSSAMADAARCSSSNISAVPRTVARRRVAAMSRCGAARSSIAGQPRVEDLARDRRRVVRAAAAGFERDDRPRCARRRPA